ncbi:MAG: FHA domain-containing protein [Alphaproteobacteria bacterium]
MERIDAPSDGKAWNPAMKAWSIGRNQDCDIVLADTSVSRVHAELVETDDGRYYLTDCGSKFGTFVGGGKDGWNPIRQVYVDHGDWIRLGEYEASISQLLKMVPAGALPRTPQHDMAPPIDEIETLSEISDLPKGPVERDPATGKIIRRS